MAVTAVTIPQPAPGAAASAQTIYTAQATTASGSAGPFPVDFFSSAGITVGVTVCSGTLDVYVQKLLPDGATYDDIAHFAQWTTAIFTTTGMYSLSFVNGGNTINQQLDAGLAVNTVKTLHFGSYWRLNWVLGTNATATFGITGDFRS
jgi:hypothetical protein